MLKSKWLTWAGISGAGCLVFGVAWLAIWSRLMHGDKNLNWLTLELPYPLGARLMVVAGLTLLIIVGITRLLRKPDKKPLAR